MFRARQSGLDRGLLDKGRLRVWLALFFIALAVPTGVLIQEARSRLKWEAFHQHRMLAEELAARIDARYGELVRFEETRGFADYAFLNVAGDPSANFLQRSPLSAYPVDSEIPGLIGYFQVDTQGALSTPLLPAPAAEAGSFGISPEEIDRRLALTARIEQILTRNRLVHGGKGGLAGRPSATVAGAGLDSNEQDEARRNEPAPHAGTGYLGHRGTAATETPDDRAASPLEEEVAGQGAFDRLNEPAPAKQKKEKASRTLGRVEDLKLDQRYQLERNEDPPRTVMRKDEGLAAERGARKEQSALPEQAKSLREKAGEAQAPGRFRITTFESDIDPFEMSLLDSGHFVLFRKVWRDGQRYIQGMLIERQPFLAGIIETAFRDTALSRMSDLVVAHQGDVFSAFGGQASRDYLGSAAELRGALLYQTRLSAPLGDLELIFSIKRLPAGPGGAVITWLCAVLAIVLSGGFFLLYRLGARQIELSLQQQDFVSAVSHELKTPLTSIRMYGEMLREGWASEEKKKTYYDYIHDESERLSRLITNVLQLARMTRNELRVDLEQRTVAELMDGVRSKISSTVERAGFGLTLDCDDGAGGALIRVDADYFSQIIINLVDNALKFARKAETKSIAIGCRLERDHPVLFTVRDYGPGVAKDQMKKIFRLFYRSENELTRETIGTGIGLALVHHLAQAMNGKVDVVNREPGAEFRVAFPVVEAAESVG